MSESGRDKPQRSEAGRPALMGRGLWLAIGFAILLVLAIVAMILWRDGDDGRRADRPVIAYMSSIALAMGEGDIAEVVVGKSGADPLYVRLTQKFDLQPIDDLRRIDALAPRALLLIQPRALGPQENVALDAWVRGGGRLILLTDPMLHRDSRYPKGDNRAPLYTSLASPLLNHWGVELTLPLDEAKPVVTRTVDKFTFDAATPGAFVYKDEASRSTAPCRIKADGLLAQCDLGEGRAVLIADVDFIDPRFWDSGGLLRQDEGIVMLESQLEAMSVH